MLHSTAKKKMGGNKPVRGLSVRTRLPICEMNRLLYYTGPQEKLHLFYERCSVLPPIVFLRHVPVAGIPEGLRLKSCERELLCTLLETSED